jgi:hypothetical protein
MIRFSLIAVALFSLHAADAVAACHWEWFCNGEGACKQMPLCESIHDRPPPKPDTYPPAMPPIAMRPYKVAGPMGTLTCEHIMRRDAKGKWRWNEFCFCTDPSRSPDPTPPFANIVRCDAPPWKECAPDPTQIVANANLVRCDGAPKD